MNYGARYDVEFLPTFPASNSIAQAAQDALGITQGMPRDNPRASMTSSAQRKPQEQPGGGALAEALRRASEKSGSGKTKA